MEQACCLGRAARIHPQLHRERSGPRCRLCTEWTPSRSAPGAHNLTKHRRSVAGPHRLAESPEEQGGLFRQEAWQPLTGGGGGPPGLHGLRGHSPKHTWYCLEHNILSAISYLRQTISVPWLRRCLYQFSAMSSTWPSSLSVYQTVSQRCRRKLSRFTDNLVQTLKDRSTNCQPVFIKSAVTSRVKLYYPFPR